MQAVIPGGSSSKILRAGERFSGKLKDGTEYDWGIDDIPLDFDGPTAAGTMSGSGGIIVMDDTVDIVEAMANINAFYAHESCGQCTPCREGSGWMWRMLERMAKGEATKDEVDMLGDVTNQIAGHTICAFGEGSSWPVQGLLRHFKKEIEERNNLDPIIQKNNNIPYLVDQHLLDKKNA